MSEFEIKPDVKNKVPSKNEVVVRLLNATSDEEFRKNLPILRENLPDAVEDFKSQKSKYENKNIKYEHTLNTLYLLDTSKIEDQESKFVARASMMFHDTRVENMANDLNSWVEQDLVSPETAFRIAQNAWRHDFLGIVVNENFIYSEEIFRIIPKSDLEINYAILLADVTEHFNGVMSTVDDYKKEIEKLRTSKYKPKELLSIDEANENGYVDENQFRKPKESEVLTHAIFENDRQKIESKTKDILTNIILGNSFKSIMLLSNIERNKTGAGKGGELAYQINASRFDTENNFISEETYNNQSISICSLVFLGKEIKDCCLLKPLKKGNGSINEIQNTAGIISKFDKNGMAYGGEIEANKAFYFVNLDSFFNLAPILKLQAMAEGKKATDFINEKVVMYIKDNLVDLVNQLGKGVLNVRESNIKTFQERISNFDKQYISGEGKLIEMSKVHQCSNPNLIVNYVDKKFSNDEDIFKNLDRFNSVIGNENDTFVSKLKQISEDNLKNFNRDDTLIKEDLDLKLDGIRLSIPNVKSYTKTIGDFNVDWQTFIHAYKCDLEFTDGSTVSFIQGGWSEMA